MNTKDKRGDNTVVLKFNGVNNKLDPAVLPDNNVVAAVNGIFTDASVFRRREGRTKLYSGTPHSVGPQRLFVENSYLKRLNADNTATTLLNVITNDKMVYSGIPNGPVFFTNNTIIGSYEDGVARLSTIPPTTRIVDGNVEIETFMEPLPAGVLLTTFNGILFIATIEGDETWIINTPAYNWSGIYINDSYMRFKGLPTLLCTVNDGIYVGAGNEIHFVDVNFKPTLVAKTTAIRGACVQTDSVWISGENAGRAILFATNDSLYAGLGGGQLVNLSKEAVSTGNATSGTAYFTRKDGTNSAVFVLYGDDTNIADYSKQPIEVN